MDDQTDSRVVRGGWCVKWRIKGKKSKKCIWNKKKKTIQRRTKVSAMCRPWGTGERLMREQTDRSTDTRGLSALSRSISDSVFKRQNRKLMKFSCDMEIWSFLLHNADREGRLMHEPEDKPPRNPEADTTTAVCVALEIPQFSKKIKNINIYIHTKSADPLGFRGRYLWLFVV